MLGLLPIMWGLFAIVFGIGPRADPPEPATWPGLAIAGIVLGIEESQDPLASLVRDVGGTVGNAVGWIAGRFSRAGNASPG